MGMDPHWCEGRPEPARTQCYQEWDSNFTSSATEVPCNENQPVRYCIFRNGGYMDVFHFGGSKYLAERLIEVWLPEQYGKRFGSVYLEQPLGSGMPSYGRFYYTSIPPGIPHDKLIGVALGIFLDYQIQFETVQGLDPRCYSLAGSLSHCSSFSNEDLPSDYLGFVSYAKNISFDSIITMLGGGWQSGDVPAIYHGSSWPVPEPALCAAGVCGDNTPYNNQCTLKIYDNDTGRYVNHQWPSILVISPIGRGDYWGRSLSDFAVPAPTPPVTSPPSPIGTPSPP
jgi:hypothetical protein